MALFPPDSALGRLQEASQKKAAQGVGGAEAKPGSPGAARIPASPPPPGTAARDIPTSPLSGPAGARIPATPTPPPGTAPRPPGTAPRPPGTAPRPPAAPPAGGAARPPLRPPPATPGTTSTFARSGTTGAAPGVATPGRSPLTTPSSGLAGGTTRPGTSPLSGCATSPAQGGLLAGSSKPLSPLSRPAAGTKDVKVTNEEFGQLRDFIYEQCGIHIAETRKYLIENRLGNRIRDLNLKTFGEYYYYLKFDANRRGELAKLFELITTNETSFYRNPPQLQVFQEAVLPVELNKLRASGNKKLRIWSAGCSTGEEPYTLAMILHEVLKGDINTWDIKITANDLSEAVLASARRGIYTEYALRTTPQEIIDRYFTKDGTNFRVDPRLKKLISFGSTNLSDRAMLKRVDRSHIIFCRNVIIYFDDEMKKQVIESFYDNLLPGGCLFIGHSESLYNISQAFKPEHHTGTIVYRKQA